MTKNYPIINDPYASLGGGFGASFSQGLNQSLQQLVGQKVQQMVESKKTKEYSGALKKAALPEWISRMPEADRKIYLESVLKTNWGRLTPEQRQEIEDAKNAPSTGSIESLLTGQPEQGPVIESQITPQQAMGQQGQAQDPRQLYSNLLQSLSPQGAAESTMQGFTMPGQESPQGQQASLMNTLQQMVPQQQQPQQQQQQQQQPMTQMPAPQTMTPQAMASQDAGPIYVPSVLETTTKGKPVSNAKQAKQLVTQAQAKNTYEDLYSRLPQDEQNKIDMEKAKLSLGISNLDFKKRDSANVATSKYYNETSRAGEAADQMNAQIEAFKSIEARGNLPPASKAAIMDSITKHGFNANYFLGPDAEQANKIVAGWMSGVANLGLGAKITDKMIELYMKGLPNLLQTRKGRATVMRDLQLMTQLKRNKSEAMENIIKEYDPEGNRPLNLPSRVHDRVKESSNAILRQYAKAEPVGVPKRTIGQKADDLKWDLAAKGIATITGVSPVLKEIAKIYSWKVILGR